MRSLALPVLIVLVCSASQQTAIAQDTMQIRLSNVPDQKLIQAIAQASKPTILTQSQFEDAKNFSYKHVIRALCGSSTATYWEEVKSLNHLPKDLSIDETTGKKVYEIKWPGCAFVLRPEESIKVKVKQGDTAFGIYKSLTGKAATKVQLSEFFSQSAGTKALKKLSPGDVLRASHASAFTSITLSGNTSFQDSFNSIIAASNPVSVTIASNNETISLGAQQPHFSITSGTIAAVNAANYVPPTECIGAEAIDQAPIAQRIVSAYALALKDLDKNNIPRSPVDVMIPDNGFFGARPTESGEIKFGDNFTARYFYVGAKYDNKIGPVVTIGEKTVYPMNYSNQLKAPTVVSGHGTHIAGLILGGADYLHSRSLFDMDGKSWLRIVPMNIGNGSDQLLSGSEQVLSLNFGLWSNKIINLSLSYRDDTTYPTIGPVIRGAIGNVMNKNLFIVAAGNEGKPDVQAVPYYPAALGGANISNLITVAAHDHLGRLTKFTNRGRDSVDIAAPGCELPSWLDDTGTVTRVSGTSQAAAITTFGAELLASLVGPSPQWIKRRLVVSGDLLEKDDSIPPTSDDLYQNIESGSRLNIATSLYTFHDFFRIRLSGDAKDIEFLGDITGLTDMKCIGKAEEHLPNVWAIKVRGSRGLMFTGRAADQLNAPCVLEMSANSALYAVPKIALNGATAPELGAPIKITGEELLLYVGRMTPN